MQPAQSTKLNDMQLFMIKQFDRPLNVEQQTEIKQLLSDYFARLVDEEVNRIWEERGMTQQDLDEIAFSKVSRVGLAGFRKIVDEDKGRDGV